MAAASAIARSSTPGTPVSPAHMRLPKVMVPVLSSSNVSTSPAASTARPDVATTLKRTSRSMPAMPMADSRPPIVVGINVTSSAASTGTPRSVPEYFARPTRVTTAIRKMIVRPASRMSNAISLGVLRRDAPSTRPIMRSRKVLPGSAVMRTTNQSLTTCVPPVTALRSPPASRITGALSPVTALSLTLATPSMTSPSDGTRSPASTSTTLPRRREEAGVGVVRLRSAGLAISLATASDRARRRLSARARPRPSATASAKVANRTVSHSQKAMEAANVQGSPVAALRAASTVTTTATISVTKMTGLRISRAGLSLATESRMARAMIVPSNNAMVSAVWAMVGPPRTSCRRAWRSVPLAGRGRVRAGIAGHPRSGPRLTAGR